jgi:hypothetical protein
MWAPWSAGHSAVHLADETAATWAAVSAVPLAVEKVACLGRKTVDRWVGRLADWRVQWMADRLADLRVACWASSTADDWVVQLAAWLAAWRAEKLVAWTAGT